MTSCSSRLPKRCRKSTGRLPMPGCSSFEAANGRHEHEWRVWRDASIPEDVLLMPGMVGHASDIIEHPRLVADRIERYAEIFGRERIIAGTDCGLAIRVGHAETTW